jgi:hypothetical protein
MPAPSLLDLAVKAKEMYRLMEANRPGSTVSSTLSFVTLGTAPGYSSKLAKFDALIQAGNDPAKFGEALTALHTAAHADADSKSLPNILDMLNHCYQASEGRFADTIHPSLQAMLTPSSAAEGAIDELTATYNTQFANVPNRAEFLHEVSRFLNACLRMDHLQNLQAAAEEIGAEEALLKKTYSEAEEAEQKRNIELKHALKQTGEELETVKKERDGLKGSVKLLNHGLEQNTQIYDEAIEQLQEAVNDIISLRNSCDEKTRIIEQQTLTTTEQAETISGLRDDLDYVSDNLQESKVELNDTQAALRETRKKLAVTEQQLRHTHYSLHTVLPILQHTSAQLGQAMQQLGTLSDQHYLTAEQNFQLLCHNMSLTIELITTQADLKLARGSLRDSQLENAALWRALTRMQANGERLPYAPPTLFRQNAQQPLRITEEKPNHAVVSYNKKMQ